MCENTEKTTKTVLDGREITEYSMESFRMEKTTPDLYRLGKRSNGEIVLQGAFFWQEGNNSGLNWRDLETVQLP